MSGKNNKLKKTNEMNNLFFSNLILTIRVKYFFVIFYIIKNKSTIQMNDKTQAEFLKLTK